LNIFTALCNGETFRIYLVPTEEVNVCLSRHLNEQVGISVMLLGGIRFFNLGWDTKYPT